MNHTYGYIFDREETEAEQQRKVLKKLSVPEGDIYVDTPSKTGKDRPGLTKMERKLLDGDLVYIKNLSLLGSSYEEILEQWQVLTKKKKADVAVLDDPLLDTRRGKEIMETFLSDVVAETLSFVAENEHEKNSLRQKKAYQAAKEQGKKYGRPMKPLPENFSFVYSKWKEGKISGRAAAAECGMPLSTFRYQVKQQEAEL